jgi:hypothetical protein
VQRGFATWITIAGNDVKEFEEFVLKEENVGGF